MPNFESGLTSGSLIQSITGKQLKYLFLKRRQNENG